MSINSTAIHREPHTEIGTILQRDATAIIDRWCRRAVEEQPKAQRLHDAALRDHLPQLLQAVGHSLIETEETETNKHQRPADQHGELRWETGWSLPEVVRDYQILRYVILEYLEETLDRPVGAREVMALGLALDEAISASVVSYERHQQQRDREAAETLRGQAAALQEMNRRKDEFLAVLGHELRNPLAPLRNTLHVLGLQRDDPAIVDWARTLMERQVAFLTRLVDDLLDAARIGQGKIVLQHDRVDLVRLVRETAEDRRGSLSEGGVELELDLAPDPLWVTGDPARLAQVVGNLLQNALKFTNRGGRVTVRVAPAAGGREAMVAVRDTGIGIDPSLLPHLFEPFQQGEGHGERGRGGLGLGLALVKGFTELHGGKVRAASAGPGRGAELTFWLPLTAGG